MNFKQNPNWTIHSHHHHFTWNREIPAVLSIAPGDIVSVDVTEASAGLLTKNSTAKRILDEKPGETNPVTGPIYVDGAQPGDILTIDFLEFHPTDWGWTGVFPDFGLLKKDFPGPNLHIWKITEDGSNLSSFGKWAKVPLNPFVGTIGVAPKKKGDHPIIPPSYYGGNLDVKHLVAGSRLHLPVNVKGALLSIGDTHAAQGDGEVCGTAIECSMNVVVKVDLVKNPKHNWPRIQLANHAQREARDLEITLGVNRSLKVAAQESLSRMIDLVSTKTGMSPEEAYMLCSVAGDLRISEIVNEPNFVVSFQLPFDIFE
ncbi:MAG: acetamidase [Parvularcula sp.]|nr:acetamidase [Parvularcula sp.]